MPSLWTRFRATIDPIARHYNHYTAYPLHTAEYIATVPGPLDRVRSDLRRNGYAPQYLSAAKEHPETGQLHDLSYRYVPHTHPAAVTGTDLVGFDARQCQYHVHAFDLGQSGIALYSHYELKPDLIPPNPTRLREHYAPSYGETYLRGVTNLPL